MNYRDTLIHDPKAIALSRATHAAKLEQIIQKTEWHAGIKDIPVSILRKFPPSTNGLWETALETSIQGDGESIKFLSKLILAMRTVNDVLNFRLAADTVCEDITLRFQDTITALTNANSAMRVLAALEGSFSMVGNDSGSVFSYALKPVLTYAPGTFSNWNDLRSKNFVKLAEMNPDVQVQEREMLLEMFDHTRYGGEFLTKGAPTIYPSIEGFLPYSEERVDFEMKHMIDKEKADLENQYKDDDTFGAF